MEERWKTDGRAMEVHGRPMEVHWKCGGSAWKCSGRVSGGSAEVCSRVFENVRECSRMEERLRRLGSRRRRATSFATRCMGELMSIVGRHNSNEFDCNSTDPSPNTLHTIIGSEYVESLSLLVVRRCRWEVWCYRRHRSTYVCCTSQYLTDVRQSLRDERIAFGVSILAGFKDGRRRSDSMDCQWFHCCLIPIIVTKLNHTVCSSMIQWFHQLP